MNSGSCEVKVPAPALRCPLGPAFSHLCAVAPSSPRTWEDGWRTVPLSRRAGSATANHCQVGVDRFCVWSRGAATVSPLRENAWRDFMQRFVHVQEESCVVKETTCCTLVCLWTLMADYYFLSFRLRNILEMWKVRSPCNVHKHSKHRRTPLYLLEMAVQVGR